MNSSTLVTLCFAFPLSPALLLFPQARVRVTGYVKSHLIGCCPTPFSLHSISSPSLVIVGAILQGSAQLSRLQFPANAKLKSIFVWTTYCPGVLCVFLPSVSFPRSLFSKRRSILLLAMHSEKWLCWCCPAFCVLAFMFTSLIKGRISLILVSKIFSTHCLCICFPGMSSM